MSFCLTLDKTDEDSAWNSCWVRKVYLLTNANLELFIILEHLQISLHLRDFIFDGFDFLLIGIMFLPEAPEH
jgi:hypothetical protein